MIYEPRTNQSQLNIDRRAFLALKPTEQKLIKLALIMNFGLGIWVGISVVFSTAGILFKLIWPIFSIAFILFTIFPQKAPPKYFSTMKYSLIIITIFSVNELSALTFDVLWFGRLLAVVSVLCSVPAFIAHTKLVWRFRN